MAFQAFAPEKLEDMGLLFESEAEKKLFSEVLTAEFERRVAAESAYMSEKGVVPLFDSEATDDELLDFFEHDLREFRGIYERCEETLFLEIRQYRAEIPHVRAVTPPRVARMQIEELEMSVRSFIKLKRAGLDTVGDVLAYGDLMTLPGMDERTLTEITVKLAELGV